jgi:Uma2 family endonuclease
MTTTVTKISPADHGRRMSLADFEHAEVQEGHLYELGRGIIIVSDVPNPRHLRQVNAIRRQLAAYDLAHPGRIDTLAGGAECKILLDDQESERHPDLAVYLTPAPLETAEVWQTWVPEIVIEVISTDSSHRDYEEKRDEYLAFGVREYWIVDADRQEMTVHRRRAGRWQKSTVAAGAIYRTSLLPGLEFHLTPIFDAARAAGS